MGSPVSRPFTIKERFTATPFIEFFNIFNRNNPGANYVTNVAAFPVPVNDTSNITGICANPPDCSTFTPITSLKQLSFPAGALGDFFGPGTTVGTAFAAQIGGRLRSRRALRPVNFFGRNVARIDFDAFGEASGHSAYVASSLCLNLLL